MQVPFSKAIGNVGLMHECFPKKLCMRTARMKQDKEAEEVRKIRKVHWHNKRSHDDLL